MYLGFIISTQIGIHVIANVFHFSLFPESFFITKCCFYLFIAGFAVALVLALILLFRNLS